MGECAATMVLRLVLAFCSVAFVAAMPVRVPTAKTPPSLAADPYCSGHGTAHVHADVEQSVEVWDAFATNSSNRSSEGSTSIMVHDGIHPHAHPFL